MAQRIVILTNYNLYESKRHFSKKLAEAFTRKGIETKIIDAKEEALEGPIGAEIKEFAPEFTCSFHSFEPLPNGKYLWDILEIPHLSMLVDPALYSIQLTNSPYTVLSSVDKSDIEAVHSFGFKKVFFLPHGIEPEITVPEKENRPYEVVFLGSCFDYESLRKYWRVRQTPDINKALDDAIDLVLSDHMISLAQALVTSWNASKLPLEKIDFKTIFYYLDNYTRGRDRVELVRAIRDVPVHIFGELVADHPVSKLTWQDYVGSQSNVKLHPSVNFEQGFEILKKSKICLNSMPFFKNGSHERVFAGLACGALPITTDGLFWREQFDIGNELLIYNPGKWEEVNELVKTVLAHDDTRRLVVNRGRKKVMEHHTWDHRASEIVKRMKDWKKGSPKTVSTTGHQGH